MPPSSRVFRVGTRASKLAVLQTRQALDRLRDLGLGLRFDRVPLSSPGDRDRATDLRESPADFFTRDLDEAVLGKTLDLAVHSAKDVPDPVAEGLDWFWLPWAADPRDVLVLRAGGTVSALPESPVIGVSSDRRIAYARGRFAGARLEPVRGNMEERIAQLDAGRFDVLVMAAAALERLGLTERITEWIPAEALTPPEGQGRLAVTYRRGDERLNRLRTLFVTSVRFVSAGVGHVRHGTLAGRDAMARADVCLYDTLMDAEWLRLLPKSARRVDVGKRCGDHKVSQSAITQALLDEARRGRSVVRLKGGDAGLFGRLAEEIEALDEHDLPYTVLPGVSSLTAATTGTGLLLTRRGVSRGFCVITPRGAGGALVPFDAAARASLPIVFFMALRVAGDIARGLMEEGWPSDTPAAVVIEAGGASEQVLRTTVGGLEATVVELPATSAGLLIVGDVCRFGGISSAGALRGARVLLTCSEALLDRAAAAVTDRGGVPVRMPLIRLAPRSDVADLLRDLDRYDGIVLTSPSAVRCFWRTLRDGGGDIRRVPRILVCGPGTASALRTVCLTPDVLPGSDYGSAGFTAAIQGVVKPGQRLLRLRSEKAGDELAQALRACGADVTDGVLYDNERILYDACPSVDAVFFASASAVESFVAQGFAASLSEATVLAIGRPTARALEQAGRAADVIGEPATVVGAIESLARFAVATEFRQK